MMCPCVVVSEVGVGGVCLHVREKESNLVCMENQLAERESQNLGSKVTLTLSIIVGKKWA